MREQQLHQLFLQRKLGNTFATAANVPLKVLEFGTYNTNSGPDFINAKILHDGLVWVGHIEFHINASDWHLHKHDSDPAYNNVIAHFVYNNDSPVKSGEYELPTIELKKLIGANIKVPNATRDICEKSIPDVSHFAVKSQLDLCFQQRLSRKSDIILRDIEATKGDIEKALWLGLARVFGSKVNAASFERLMCIADIQAVRQWIGAQHRHEAILLGQSGLLPKSSSNCWIQKMIDEYALFKRLFHSAQMNSVEWKYSRMHPFGFPDIRIAQLAAVIQNGLNVGDIISSAGSVDQLKKFFEVTPSEFWQNHYQLSHATQPKSSHLSSRFIDLLLINAVLPFIHAVGRYYDLANLRQSAAHGFQQIAPEQNSIVKNWQKSGLKPLSAHDTQALLELKSQFCDKKKCLLCNIGKELLNR